MREKIIILIILIIYWTKICLVYRGRSSFKSNRYYLWTRVLFRKIKIT